MTAKDRIVDIMLDLPDDATIEDALYELYVALKIERGLEQADKGKELSTKRQNSGSQNGSSDLDAQTLEDIEEVQEFPGLLIKAQAALLSEYSLEQKD